MENLLKNELFTHVSTEELEKIISAFCFRGQFLSTASA